MKTGEEIAMDIRRRVKAICRALSLDGPEASPEELARRCHACLVAAAAMRLIVAGHAGQEGELDEGLIGLMVAAAFDAMDDVVMAERALST